eukprot:301381-Heterocapsa_arctica.AAC.1
MELLQQPRGSIQLHPASKPQVTPDQEAPPGAQPPARQWARSGSAMEEPPGRFDYRGLFAHGHPL